MYRDRQNEIAVINNDIKNLRRVASELFFEGKLQEATDTVLTMMNQKVCLAEMQKEMFVSNASRFMRLDDRKEIEA